MTQVAQLRLLLATLHVRPRIRIGGEYMRFFATHLAIKVCAILIVRAILATEAFLLRPHQRARHGVMFVAHEGLRPLVQLGQELLRPFRVQQSLAVSENTARFHTASSKTKPMNQRNRTLQSICSTNNCPEQTE